MPRYKVTVTETVQYVVPVEAKDEDEAREVAVEAMIDGDGPQHFSAVLDRSATLVLKA